MPKLMIDGLWRGDVADQDAPRIAAGAFRDVVATDPAARFPAVPGRYHLFVSYACPFAHRTIIVHALKRLGGVIGLSVLHPHWNTAEGWVFAETPLSTPDLSGAGFTHLHQAYAASEPGYSGRVSVPVLWDTRERRIVNNESRDIITMLNRAFDRLGGGGTTDLRPEALSSDVELLADRIARDIAAGVYKVGGAHDQAAYDAAADALFGLLDDLDDRLSDGRAFLHGAAPTLSDIVLFTPLIRFDAVYNPLFRASRRRLADYPALSAWAERFLALPGVGRTVRFDHILRHYHDGDWGVANRRDIVPDLPHPLGRALRGARCRSASMGGLPLRTSVPPAAA